MVGGYPLCGSLGRGLEPSLLNEALAERRGLDRFDIGLRTDTPPDQVTIGQESFACCPCGKIHHNASLLL